MVFPKPLLLTLAILEWKIYSTTIVVLLQYYCIGFQQWGIPLRRDIHSEYNILTQTNSVESK